MEDYFTPRKETDDSLRKPGMILLFIGGIVLLIGLFCVCSGIDKNGYSAFPIVLGGVAAFLGFCFCIHLLLHSCNLYPLDL